MIIAVTAFGAEELNKKQRHSQLMSAERAREIRDNKTNTKHQQKKSAVLWSLYNQFRIQNVNCNNFEKKKKHFDCILIISSSYSR